jgi:POT family proton-dependent oligopeptide transporter/mRNA interferase RelE/StbE
MFLAFNFALHLIAGYIGGRYVSNRALLLISTIFQIIGVHILSWTNSSSLIYGLSLFLIGCGINSTCLKCILIQQFEHNNDQREMAFFINYAITNIGFLLGFWAGGYYDLSLNYSQLFKLCNLFNIISVLCILLGWNSYKEQLEIKIKSYFRQAIIISAIFLYLLWIIIQGFVYPYLSNILVVFLGLLTVIYLIYQTKITKERYEKRKINAFLILTISSIIFWTLFYVGPMGMTYFLKDNVNAKLFGMLIPPQWYMNLNAIFVITGSPIAALLFQKLREHGYDFSLSQKFSFAITLISISFFVLSLGVMRADELGYVSSLWVVLHFLFQAIGEVFIAPVGFSMVGQLAPKRLQGIMMGFWMMVSGIAASLSHFLSNEVDYSASSTPLVSNPEYLNFFDHLGSYALLLALLLIAFSKKIERLISVKSTSCNVLSEHPVALS